MVAYDENGDMILIRASSKNVFHKVALRQVGWQVNGGRNSGMIIHKDREEVLKSVTSAPHGSISPVYVEVGS